MTLFDRILGVLRREAADARELAAEARDKLDATLSRKERELEATPEERVEMTKDEIAAADAEYERLRDSLARGASDTDTAGG